MQNILIIDPESDFLEWAARHLGNTHVAVQTCTTFEQGQKLMAASKPDIVILELYLKPINGMEILKLLRQSDPNSMVILNTAFPPTNAVIESMKLGAFDFLRKEALPYDLRPVVESALRARDEMKSPGAPISPEIDRESGDHVMIGRSPVMQDVFKMIGRVSRSDAAVMITGESGCGKEVVARAIHKYSPRAGREFLAINCAAIPDNLLESELFGHEKGSFTGATTLRVGRFEQCDGGTLFLDEIGDMPLQVQSKILRVLQEGEFSRLGGNQTLRTDVRIIAATNKNLEKEVESSRFREDLFYRLNVVRIHLPPLRERPEDIRILAEFFLQRIAKKRHNPKLRIAEETSHLLESYNWPGNVRELENTILRACALTNTDVLLPRDIPIGQATLKATEEEPWVRTALASAVAAGEPPIAWLTRHLAEHALSVSDNDAAKAAALLKLRPAAFKKILASE